MKERLLEAAVIASVVLNVCLLVTMLVNQQAQTNQLDRAEERITNRIGGVELKINGLGQ